MKKIAILFIIGILVGSTLGVAGININQQAAMSLSQHISTPQMQIQSTSNEYIMLELEGSSTYLSTAGHPRLPEIIQVIELPFGSTEISVSLTPQDITTQQIDQEIKPAAALLPLTPEYQSIAAGDYNERCIDLCNDNTLSNNLVHHNNECRIKQKQPTCYVSVNSLLSDSIHTSNRNHTDSTQRRRFCYLYTTRKYSISSNKYL